MSDDAPETAVDERPRVRGGNRVPSVQREHLVERLSAVAAGDRAALGDVYRMTAAKLFGVCIRILGNRAEAEDVLQEVYLTVWHKAGTFDPARASPITWLATIARNRAIDRLRTSSGRPRSEPIDEVMHLSDPAPDALSGIEAADENRQLMECLEELDQKQAHVIRTAFLEGVTYEALAERTGAPLGTVKSWVRRGLLKLRSCLER
ncbi:sigma-70 family RNA polymerase sigma factor [Chelatococcus reniformis]|uniref:RNA polymerase sigma factor n=1 Tax=Chelatococcus reniformis TaxID=1494448 RepID=A0A916UJ84_9HYPH|nr:sigma-70 family RNA polymerase sigma factor [Chelatococcus reniformis]GGC74176.1 RNA polymerase sigma factor [Chelatococcus reniformis]